MATTTQQPTTHHAVSDPGRKTRTVAAAPTSVAAALDQQDPDGIPITKTKSRRIGDDEIAKIVAEEREGRSKFPRYPGLERWELVEKMGDGAFSNVYRARDRTGVHTDDVAIKVVRKYEMNVTQVRFTFICRFAFWFFGSVFCFCFRFVYFFRYGQVGSSSRICVPCICLTASLQP